MPLAEVVFVTLGDAFAQVCALGAFTVLRVVGGAVVVGVVRGVVKGVVVDLIRGEVSTNNSVVTQGPTCGTVFPS